MGQDDRSGNEATTGWQPVLAYSNGTRVVVFGQPVDCDDEEGGHNCEEMGCGSAGAHVVGRFTLPWPIAGAAPGARQAEEAGDEREGMQ